MGAELRVLVGLVVLEVVKASVEPTFKEIILKALLELFQATNLEREGSKILMGKVKKIIEEDREVPIALVA